MGLLSALTGFFKDNEVKREVNIPDRNKQCWCGSGRKYKKCHLLEDERKASSKYHLNCGST